MISTPGNALPEVLRLQLPAGRGATGAAPRAAEALVRSIAVESLAGASGAPRYQMRLEVAGQQLEVQSRHPFPEGTRLLVRAVSPEQVRVERVLNEPARQVERVLREALREVLPRQQPLARLLPQLQAASRNPSLAPVVREAIQQLLLAVPRSDTLQDAAGVRRAIQDSGLFAEQRLSELPAGGTTQRRQAAVPGAPQNQATSPTRADSRPGPLPVQPFLRTLARLLNTLPALQSPVTPRQPGAPPPVPPAAANNPAAAVGRQAVPGKSAATPAAPAPAHTPLPSIAAGTTHATATTQARGSPPAAPPAAGNPTATQPPGTVVQGGATSGPAGIIVSPRQAPDSRPAASARPASEQRPANPAERQAGPSRSRATASSTVAGRVPLSGNSTAGTPTRPTSRAAAPPTPPDTQPQARSERSAPAAVAMPQPGPRNGAAANAPARTPTPLPPSSTGDPPPAPTSKAGERATAPPAAVPATGINIARAAVNSGRGNNPLPATPPTPSPDQPPGTPVRGNRPPPTTNQPPGPRAPTTGERAGIHPNAAGSSPLPGSRQAAAATVGPDTRAANPPTTARQDLPGRNSAPQGPVVRSAPGSPAPQLESPQRNSTQPRPVPAQGTVPARQPATAKPAGTGGGQQRAVDMPQQQPGARSLPLAGTGQSTQAEDGRLQTDLKASLARVLQALGGRSTVEARGSGSRPGSSAGAASPPLYTAEGRLGGQAGGELTTGKQPPGDQAAPTRSLTGGLNPAAVELQVLEQIEAALARTRLHQFVSLAETSAAQTEQPASQLNLEIPVSRSSQFDNLGVRIDSDETRDADGNTTMVWRVLLSLDISGLGPIHVQLQLAQQALRATLWAEREPTLATIREELQQLEHAFTDIGVELQHLECLPGRPEAKIGVFDGPLLDVRT